MDTKAPKTIKYQGQLYRQATSTDYLKGGFSDAVTARRSSTRSCSSCWPSRVWAPTASPRG